jgi:putative flavoprotein involved in K+ transport
MFSPADTARVPPRTLPGWVTQRASRSDHETVVIGGGQAGLAMSRVLQHHGREHIVLERRRIGERWRTERWDSLRFQFPNWSLELPGFRYSGDDPDGFAHYSEIGKIIDAYARGTKAVVREGTEVLALKDQDDQGGFILSTHDGSIQARRVIIATGPFQRPLVPELAQAIPPSVYQTDPTRYRSPAALPSGAVLVVGSGASGYQIADELHQAGRRVYLSISSHRRVPRRFRGRDVYWWLERMGRFAQAIDSFPDRRWPPSTVVTGVSGGYDINVRSLVAAGVEVAGRAVGTADGIVVFDDTANTVLNAADKAYTDFVSLARDLAATEVGEELTEDDDADMVGNTAEIESLRSIDMARMKVGTIIWATGYAYDYNWVHVPVIDSRGRPVQHRGVSERRGLYFLGLHWMHTFRSGLFSGVGADAEYIADHMARPG